MSLNALQTAAILKRAKSVAETYIEEELTRFMEELKVKAITKAMVEAKKTISNFSLDTSNYSNEANFQIVINMSDKEHQS